MKLSIGIDVSKEKLDVSVYDKSDHRLSIYPNSKTGIMELHSYIKKLTYTEIIITMEATGTYHLKAAKLLYKLGYTVSVVNPLIIRRYSEMKMIRAKTDPVDSRTIAEYGFNEKVSLYKPKNKQKELILQLSKAIDDLNTMKTANSNRIEALSQDPDMSLEVLNIYNDLNTMYKMKIKEIENKIKALLKDNIIVKNMRSVPGIGERTAPVLFSMFEQFEQFENAKQVASFIGINPSPHFSGTSVKGKGSISKKGDGYIRKLLYMAALSAKVHNKQCRDLYNRLLSKKEKKVALIAVANKLIRQIFAITKYNRVYDENYLATVKNACM